MSQATRPPRYPTLRRRLLKLQTLWSMIGVWLLIILVAEGALRLMFHYKDTVWDQQPVVHNPAVEKLQKKPTSWTVEDYEKGAFGDFYQRGHGSIIFANMEWHPYVYFRHSPIESEFVNVDQHGIRKTWNPDPPPAGAKRIFMFGGSTIWGENARDDFTIPSHLSRMLAEEGVPVEVTNFGECGYVSTQDLLTLTLRLRAGERPDLAIFYGAVNDVASAYQAGRAGIPQNESNRRREFRKRFGQNNKTLTPSDEDVEQDVPLQPWEHSFAIRRLAASLRQRIAGEPLVAPKKDYSPTNADELARSSIKQYADNLRLIQALADTYKFSALFYWQPVSYTKKTLTSYEKEGGIPQEYLRSFFLKAYESVDSNEELKQIDQFHDISDIFDASSHGYYVDFAHLTEEGNELVARRMLPDVMEVLEPQSPAPSSSHEQ